MASLEQMIKLFTSNKLSVRLKLYFISTLLSMSALLAAWNVQRQAVVQMILSRLFKLV